MHTCHGGKDIHRTLSDDEKLAAGVELYQIYYGNDETDDEENARKQR